MSGPERWVDQAIHSLLNQTSLSEDKERALLDQSRSGATADMRRQAVSQLWQSYSKLVVAIANRHRRPGIDILDLVGAGHLGLHSAITGFDPLKGGRLGPFAATWIRWSIRDYVRRNVSTVRLPESRAHRQIANFSAALIKDARNSCKRECIEATTQNICERVGARVGLSAEEVERSLRLLDGGVISLHAPDEVGRSDEALPDESALSEDDVIFRLDREKAQLRALELAREILGERERAVFLARCMPGASDRLSLEELARRFAVTPERIHQLEASGRRKIATALAGEGFQATPAIPRNLPAFSARRGPERRQGTVQRRAVARTASLTA